MPWLAEANAGLREQSTGHTQLETIADDASCEVLPPPIRTSPTDVQASRCSYTVEQVRDSGIYPQGHTPLVAGEMRSKSLRVSGHRYCSLTPALTAIVPATRPH